MNYSKVGRGPHLCFLHGFCENKGIWDEVIDHLQKNYTCTSIDLPGFGLSKNGSFDSLHQVAIQIEELLQEINVVQPILFGHSMGGYVVAEYMQQFGTKLRAAAFIHSTSRSDSDVKIETREKTIEFVQRNGREKFFPLFVDGLVAEKNRESLRPVLLNMVSETTEESIVAGLQSMKAREDRLETVANFNKPVMFLMGMEDHHYPSDEIYHQVAQCKLSQIEVLPDVGHLSMFEDKKKCLKSIKHFLQFVELTT